MRSQPGCQRGIAQVRGGTCKTDPLSPHSMPRTTHLHELVKALEGLAAGLAHFKVRQEGGTQVLLWQ